MDVETPWLSAVTDQKSRVTLDRELRQATVFLPDFERDFTAEHAGAVFAEACSACACEPGAGRQRGTCGCIAAAAFFLRSRVAHTERFC